MKRLGTESGSGRKVLHSGGADDGPYRSCHPAAKRIELILVDEDNLKVFGFSLSQKENSQWMAIKSRFTGLPKPADG